MTKTLRWFTWIDTGSHSTCLPSGLWTVIPPSSDTHVSIVGAPCRSGSPCPFFCIACMALLWQVSGVYLRSGLSNFDRMLSALADLSVLFLERPILLDVSALAELWYLRLDVFALANLWPSSLARLNRTASALSAVEPSMKTFACVSQASYHVRLAWQDVLPTDTAIALSRQYTPSASSFGWMLKCLLSFVGCWLLFRVGNGPSESDGMLDLAVILDGQIAHASVPSCGSLVGSWILRAA